MEEPDRIASYFENKTLFITGATGFVGKVLVEKLLRCCPGLKQIFLLIRPKKGMLIKERLTDMFSQELFHKLRYKQPNFREKVTAIEGYLDKPGLGISQSDREMVLKETEVVIHAAATVKFDEHIRVALQVNVIAVKEVIDLCKQMKNIEVLCHVSTAYSKCDQFEEIEERIYPVSVSPQKLLDMCEWMTDDMLSLLTPSLLKDYPNTYTFTKGLAEYLLYEQMSDIPCCIIRPSIITPIYQGPLPGWVDNYNGANGLVLGVGKGLIRTMRCGKDSVSNMVPVDYVGNGIIVTTAQTARKRQSGVTVFNCTALESNWITWKYFNVKGFEMLKRYPLEEIFRRPNFEFTTNSMMHFYWSYVSHRIPALVADTLFLLIGSRPRIWRLYSRVEKAVKVVEPFTRNHWTWSCNNLTSAIDSLHEADRETFCCDMRTLKWKEYIEIYVLGVKRFLAKDDMQDLTKARRTIMRFRLVRWIFYVIFCMTAWRFMMFKSPRFRQLWFRVLSYCYNLLKSVNLVSR